MDNPITSNKVYLKHSADRKRCKEMLELYRQLEDLTNELGDPYISDEMRVVMEDRARFYIERLKDLDSLKKKSSKIDPNIFVKVGAIAGLGILVTLIELPGNLVNLRALKAIRPLIDLLKL